tara:strand:+ start:1701 stop:2693 length:993 start_codon:yes stop_codon:yes gene_type:complete
MAITFLDGLITSGDLTVSGGDITLGGTGRIQGVDTVTNNTDAANKLYVDNAISGVPQGTITGVTAGTGMTGGGTSGTVVLNVIGGTGIDANLGNIAIDSTVLTTTGSQTITGAKRFNGSILDKDGSSGSAGQVLASTGAGQVDWVAASSGGGIQENSLTPIENQYIAVGTSSSTVGGFSKFIWTPQGGLQVGNASSTQGNIITINRPSGQPGRFIIKQGITTEFSITTGGDTNINVEANNLLVAENSTAKVAIGNITPYSKLSVDGGVQIGDDQATGLALANKVGTFRYYEVLSSNVKASYSYVDMVMKTGGTTAANFTYAWINIVTNNW